MIYRFDRFQVDDESFRLTADGKPISLEPKTLRLLLYLVENGGRLHRKQELLDAIWQDAAVTENALTRCVGLLRRSLNDSSREPRFIETVPTAGYRFIAPVEAFSPQLAAKPAVANAARAAEIASVAIPEATSSDPRAVRLAVYAASGLLVFSAICWFLIAHFRAAPSPHPHINPAAHDAYLRGRYFYNKQDISRSVSYFQQAISIDPGYAPAYAAYSSAYESLSAFGMMEPDQVMPKALAAAQRAIQLDPGNSEAFTELGSIQTIYTYQWAAAEQNLLRGISLDPANPIAEFKYATYLDAVGRTDEAVAHMRRAVTLDPLSFLMNRRLGATLYLARDYNAALAELQGAAEMENSPATVDHYQSLVYEQIGEQELAIQHDLNALHAGYPRLDTKALQSVYRRQGWQSYWRARSHALLTVSPTACTAYVIGVDDLRVGDTAHAFDSFQHALDDHCFDMSLIRADPLFDSVRQDPRYTALLRRMNQ